MKRAIILSLLVTFSFILQSMAQKPGDGSPSQRLEIARQKLETMRSSLGSAIRGLKEDNKDKDKKDKKDDKDAAQTPGGRLRGLEKEVSSLQSEVNSLRGKVDRSEKYEISDIDNTEASVSELQARVENALTETAGARANPKSDIGDAREIKKKKKFLWIFGKGGNDEYDELIGSVKPGRDKELFVVATREVRKGNHEIGRLLFNVIITTYPDSPYLPMSKLAIADSFYLEGNTSNLIQAGAGYQDWLTFFPTHPLADRVLLKIAESEMRQIGLPDRDATRAKRAEQKLKVLLQNYPNSILIADTKERLNQVQDNLGLHNLWVANFYYRRSIDQQKSGLKGSQSRYREILEKYPNFSYMDEALFKLGVTYQAEEETDEAVKHFQRVVRDFPNSPFKEEARKQLELMGATIPEPNPDRKSVFPPEKAGFFNNLKNQFFGVYPMTIDKNGVLMTKEFDRAKFELIDQVIENGGDLAQGQIPKAFTTILGNRPAAPSNPANPR